MRKIEIIFVIFIIIGIVEKCCPLRDEFSHSIVKIGGLFDGESVEAETVFKYATRKVRKDRNLVQIEGSSKKVIYGNEFDVAQKVCKMIEDGVVGVVGPSSPESTSHIRSICDAKEIPLIEISVDGSSKHVINLHPTSEELGRVYLEIIHSAGWNGFTILFENAPWLPMVEHVLKNYNKDKTVTVRQIDLTGESNFRDQLKMVKHSGDKNIVLCSSIESLPEILKQAQQVGLMTDEHQIIVTSLDMHTLDLESFQYSGTNITGFRLVSPDDEYVQDLAEQFQKYYLKKRRTTREASDEDDEEEADEEPEEEKEVDVAPEGLTAEKMRLNTALTFDAVSLFAQVMAENLDVSSSGVSCYDQSRFINGTSIFNAMKTIPSFKGLSGEMQFDQQGNRENFQLEILEMTPEGLSKVGIWNGKEIQSLRTKAAESGPIDPNTLQNKTLRVLTVINHPYGMLKETEAPLKGNDRFEGFGIELIDKLSARLGFNYEFILQEDGAYGSQNKETGQWNGMIRQLMDGNAELAVTDLTITAERESAIDFTMPFMNLGISILFEKPKKEDPELFSFLQPFSGGVWGCLFACFFLVTISLFVMGRLSPTEWDNPFPCIQEPEVLINQFSFKNSMWFTLGALLQQGSEIAPKATSTRIVASMWWFFTLIMISSYTANLAAFLTVENPASTIESVDDLVAGKVPYGSKNPGATYSFFQYSTNEKYKQMYDYMSQNPELMTSTNDAGVAKASAGRYAFLMESSTIEYTTQRNCDVVQVGNKLDEKGYGIAMKKDSPYRGQLSEAVLLMQQSGELSRMKTKWWNEKRGGGACAGGDEGGGTDKLNMKNLGGVFVVLCFGCLLAFVMGLVRWFVNVKQMSRNLEIPFSEVMLHEFRFFLKFGTNVKTVQTRKNSSQLDFVNGSQGTRSRSSGGINNNESIGFRMSLKNLHKLAKDEDYNP